MIFTSNARMPTGLPRVFGKSWCASDLAAMPGSVQIDMFTARTLTKWPASSANQLRNQRIHRRPCGVSEPPVSPLTGGRLPADLR